MSGDLQQIAQALAGAKRVFVVGHINPDGDSLGSILSVALAVRSLGIECSAVSADGVPSIYAWMPGAATVVRKPPAERCDVAVVCDSGALTRIGDDARAAVAGAALLINIDHHLDDQPFGALRLVDIRSASTTQIITRVIDALEQQTGKTIWSAEIAECIMTGLVTDTGSFRFLNVSPETFELAARMQRLGAVPGRICDLVFETRSKSSVKLLGRALDRLHVAASGSVAWAVIRAADFEEMHAGDEESEGIVNHLRSIADVQLGILFREIPGWKVRISMRAREGADANALARMFGGGGHRLAAGCALDPPLDEVVAQVVAAAIAQTSA